MKVRTITPSMKCISEPGGCRHYSPRFGEEDIGVAVAFGPEPPHASRDRGIVDLEVPEKTEDPGVVPVLAPIRPLDCHNSCTGVHLVGQHKEVLQELVEELPVASQLLRDAVAGHVDVLKLRTARAGD